MNPKIVEKFFTNQTTPAEARKVLEWFETPEGHQYLQEMFANDFKLLNREDLHSMVPELNSEKIYSSIEIKIHNRRNVFSLKRTDWLGYAVKAAAAVLVILTASLFTISHQQFLEDQIVEREPVIFQTNGEQQKEITLSDGTVVRMNYYSEMIVSKDFMHGSREISLSGEAYFDVTHNPDQPFILHANQSTVEVLGTAFNVRSVAGQQKVQVAVVEGRISFRGAENGLGQEQLSVILSKNQYGHFDLNNRTMNVDDMAVENYLAWKSGWFNFEKLTMQQVCTQLNRLYNIHCRFKDEQISKMNLTARFSNKSMEKTLEVIALSLELEFEMNDNVVSWSNTL